MSAFTGPLSLTQVKARGRMWMLNEPLRYEVAFEGSGRIIEAPAGMCTDGASVPRPLWALLPSWGSYSRAVVIHDRLCELLKASTPHPEAKTWAKAADLLWEAMGPCKTGWPARVAIWAACRLWAILKDRRH